MQWNVLSVGTEFKVFPLTLASVECTELQSLPDPIHLSRKGPTTHLPFFGYKISNQEQKEENTADVGAYSDRPAGGDAM